MQYERNDVVKNYVLHFLHDEQANYQQCPPLHASEVGW